METIRVQMIRELLFDFLLYHTYSKASGFLVNMLGLGVAAVGGVMQAMGQIKTGQLALYLLAAAAFLLYTPLLLRRRAKKQMQLKKAILKAAKEVYVLADSSKFGGGYLSVICPINAVYKIITDSHVSKENIAIAKEMKVPLVIAKE